MRVISSLWSKPFINLIKSRPMEQNEYLFNMLAYSIQQARSVYGNSHVYADVKGIELIQKLGITADSFTEIEIKLSDKLWACSKFYAYRLQTEPFVHIDNDFIFFKRILGAENYDVVYFGKEDMNINFGYSFDEFESKIQYLNETWKKYDKKFACNCGMVMFNNIDFARFYTESFFDIAEKNVFDVFTNSFIPMVNLEQALLMACINRKNVKSLALVENMTCLKRQIISQKWIDTGYIHLLGDMKRIPHSVEYMRDGIRKQYPMVYDNIQRIIKDGICG